MLGDLAAQASLWNRRRKLALFLETMRPGPETHVVDVGVGDTPFGTEPGVAATHNFFEALYPWPEQITAVSDVPLPNFGHAFPSIRTVVANGLELPFADDEFDVAFSNAVIEHVGGRGEQRRFVAELCRVAPRVFVSTPNRWFPVETHTLVPFVHWLPQPRADRAMHVLRREHWDGIELLTKRELLAMFPSHVRARAVEARITISVAAER